MALYPPIVASSMPAFAGNEVRIYFTLSDYNSINEIAQVHATVRRQSSNVNVLNSESEIRSYSFNGEVKEDSSILNRYYITIKSEDLIQSFEANVLYKVQLRFSSISNSSNSSSFFVDNISYFSQWSTVCIIKKINPPRFYIDQFTAEDERDQAIDISLSSTNYYFNELADFNIVYESIYSEYQNGQPVSIQSQTLNKYKIQLFDHQKNLLASSGDILSSAYNYTANTNSVVISCSLPYQFVNETDYKVKLTIETRNGYIGSKTYDFTTFFQIKDPLDAELSAVVNEEEGYIKLEATIHEAYIGNLVIRRSDAKGNFLNWTDLKHYLGTGEQDQVIEYYDFTAESGMVYKYLIQKRNRYGSRGTPVYASYKDSFGNIKELAGIMGEWQNAFLLQSNNGELSETKQLKLAFDFQLSAYKYNILEGKTDTLGSKYPFIKRNGDNYYRSFGCSGTITSYMDQAELFTSNNQLYYNQTEIYDKYKGDVGNYTRMYDYTYERKFREKVEEFLHNSKPKLYKSLQEGNMLIKLMDISLSPKNELGRLIYTFTATMCEIDDNDVQTLVKYNFIKPGVYNTQLINQKDTIGRLTGYINKDSYADLDHPVLNKFKANVDILNPVSQITGDVITSAAGSIAQNIKYKQVFNGKVVNNFRVDWLRITVEDDPYLIVKGDNGYQPRTELHDKEKVQKTIQYKSSSVIRNYNMSGQIPILLFETPLEKLDFTLGTLHVDFRFGIAPSALYGHVEFDILQKDIDYDVDNFRVRYDGKYLNIYCLENYSSDLFYVIQYSFLSKKSNSGVDNNLYFFKQRPKVNNNYIGTLMYFNGNPIIIAPPNNIYQFSDIKLTPSDSIVFAKDTAATIDYHVVYNEVDDKGSQPSKTRQDLVNGYVQGVYQNTDIVDILITKYRFSNEETRTASQGRIERKLLGVNTILIDTQPGTIVYIKTNQMDQFGGASRFIVGFTGELKIDFVKQVGTYITSYVIEGKDGNPVPAMVYYCATVGRQYY